MDKKKKTKKGCFKQSLFALFVFILIVGAALLLLFLNNDNTEYDERFEALLNQNFDTTQFTDQVSRYRADFGEKLRNCTNSPNICDDNGNIDYEIFASSATRLTSDLNLDKYDLANLCTQLNRLYAFSSEGEGALIGALGINRIAWTLSQNCIDYKIVYEVNLSQLKSMINFKNVPSQMFMTVEASLDITLANPVKSVSIFVNSLEGDDNEYCVNTLFELLKLSSDTDETLAYLPMNYLGQINLIWQTRFVIGNEYITVK